MDALARETLRRAKRVEVSIPTTLVRASGEREEIELRDLSLYGFKAYATTGAAPGEYVKLDLPNLGLVRARISWSRDGYLGGAFPTAVDVRKCVPAAGA